VPRRLAPVGRLAREIATADRAAFNENGRFVEATEAVLGQVGGCTGVLGFSLRSECLASLMLSPPTIATLALPFQRSD
jgi:hypothetical protein